MTRPLAALICCFAAVPGLLAQTPSEAENGAGIDGEAEVAGSRRGFWRAELPGGIFLIAHRSIGAVSSQEYLLDGAARVTEVNIMTPGVFQPRFYCIEPLTVQAPLGQAVVDRARSAVGDLTSRVAPGVNPGSKVVKSYPTTTHAGTIEYRLETKAQLKKLFESLEDSWTSGRGVTFRLDGVTSADPQTPAAVATDPAPVRGN